MGSKQSRQSSGDVVGASQNHDRRRKSKPVAQSPRTPRRSTLNQNQRILIETLKSLKGEEGLTACGLEYRSVTIGEDGQLLVRSADEALNLSQAIPNSNMDHDGKGKDENCIEMTKLFHKESNTMITSKNRKEYIADGTLYDIVCRLAMEYSQEVMAREGQMEWVTIEESNQWSTQPIRALVSRRIVEDESRLDKEPTLLMITGNGYVRTGIFSRQHLLITGLECSSMVDFVREAFKRSINIIILDPNARGDRFGFATVGKSMARLFRRWEVGDTSKHANKNLYVLSHSQSGAQFVRYLLEKGECYIPRISAIAFTDSTHNIQWTKQDSHEFLRNLLQSDRCIYFKRSDNRAGHVLKPVSTIGEKVGTNEFWEHRFGKIKTLCAGTSEHSLTNWFTRFHIFDHFDRYMAANECVVEKNEHQVNESCEC